MEVHTVLFKVREIVEIACNVVPDTNVKSTASMIHNGATISITQNLYNALCIIRDVRITNPIWVDVIYTEYQSKRLASKFSCVEFILPLDSQ